MKKTLLAVAALLPALALAEPAGLDMWSKNHPQASRELGRWVQNHPDAARQMFEWDGTHPERSREFVTWTIVNPGAPIQIGDDAHWTLVNDFGPGSIDGWLSEVVGRELAADEATVLDPDARRLVLDGRGVDLSRLELDVLRHLQRREGVAVTREELLREVWGHEWTGASSNVVEAVVSGLRKKMGGRAAALETVRGVGYRLGPLH